MSNRHPLSARWQILSHGIESSEHLRDVPKQVVHNQLGIAPYLERRRLDKVSFSNVTWSMDQVTQQISHTSFKKSLGLDGSRRKMNDTTLQEDHRTCNNLQYNDWPDQSVRLRRLRILQFKK